MLAIGICIAIGIIVCIDRHSRHRHRQHLLSQPYATSALAKHGIAAHCMALLHAVCTYIVPSMMQPKLPHSDQFQIKVEPRLSAHVGEAVF